MSFSRFFKETQVPSCHILYHRIQDFVSQQTFCMTRSKRVTDSKLEAPLFLKVCVDLMVTGDMGLQDDVT